MPASPTPEMSAMPIQCSCPECDYTYTIADELAGKSVLCPECKTRFKAKGVSVAKKRPHEDDEEDADDAPPAEPPATKRKGFPLWTLAVLIPASLAVLGCGGIGVVALLYFNPTRGPSDVWAGGGRPGEAAPALAHDPSLETIDTQDLYVAYTGNQAAADLKYKGRRIEVCELGAPQGYMPVGMGDDTYVLTLHAPQVNHESGPSVVAHFLSSEAGNLARLGTLKFRGDGVVRLIVRGTCAGMRSALPGQAGQVVIRDATLTVVSIERIEVGKKSTVFRVAANEPWQDTGVDVTDDSNVYYATSGVWYKGRMACAGNGVGAPGGGFARPGDPPLPAAGYTPMVLVGKIGRGGTPFFAWGLPHPTPTPLISSIRWGTSRFQAEKGESGRLFLQANDGNLQENSGSLDATITVTTYRVETKVVIPAPQ
jgi:hypothetical protein